VGTQRNDDPRTVREVALRYRGRGKRAPEKIRNASQVAAFFRRAVVDDAREHFLALYLDGRHQALGYRVVSIGTATASLVHPREVFQPAVLLGACAIVIGHNHPSGDPTPSREDLDVTQRLFDAGKLLGITLIDHVVWTREGAFHSFAEHDALPR
jgi:DNA repair protein RadC